MKNTSPDTSGRILRHGNPANDVTEDAIERRAQELAQIDGRSTQHLTPEDRRQARAELYGDLLPEGTLTDDVETVGLTRDPSDPLAIPGIQAPEQNEPEDQQIEERLVLEGVEEAQHDQMLAASRKNRRDSL